MGSPTYLSSPIGSHRRAVSAVLPSILLLGLHILVGGDEALARTIYVTPVPGPETAPEDVWGSGRGDVVCGSVVSDSTKFELCLEGSVFEFGDPVVMSYTVTNLSAAPQTYTLPTTCEEHFFVTEADCGPGECPSEWLLPRLCFFLETSFDLGPGETRDYEFVWTQHRTEGERLRPGAYRAWATLYWEGESALASVPFGLVSHGPEPIQQALDLAAEGDTVLVAHGLYRENLNFLPAQSGVVLLSESGPECTILDGDGRGSVVYLRGLSGETVIEGFTIRGGEAGCGSPLDCPDGLRGGGMTLLPGVGARIRNNVIAENHSSINGGGVAVQYPTTADLTGNLFLRNLAEGQGGGVYCQGGNLDIIGNTFVGNEAGVGGGVYDRADTQFARIVQNIFYANTAGSSGAVRCAASTGEYCNAYWENSPEDADVSCGGLVNAVLTDPLFCIPGLDEYSLRAGSPCLPENSPCGELIGAYGEVCEPASVDEEPGGVAGSGLTVLGPNPTRGEVRIAFQYDGSERGLAEVSIFDVRGRLVRTVPISGRIGQFAWDGRDTVGEMTAAGIYWARLNIGGDSVSEVALVRLN